MKKIITICLMLLSCCHLWAQQRVTAKVISTADNQPIAGANVKIAGLDKTIITGKDGGFSFVLLNDTATLQITYIGYIPRSLTARQVLTSLLVGLTPSLSKLDEVTVSTGYQVLPKERATGSFTHIDHTVFNEQVGTGVLSRLEAVANGVSVDRTTGGSNNSIMIRGLSTIQGPKAPLVVVDNFPYDGDINNINPNDVESITILKDAAAASIWGARAGNGVIVITTKKARLNQPLTIDFNANFSSAAKPDLSYIRQMSSSDFIDVERYLFGKGFYKSQIRDSDAPPLTPVVALLEEKKTGAISAADARSQIDALRNTDIRDDFNKYMYQRSADQQYALSLRGGTEKSAWSASTGYDKDIGNLDEAYSRYNLHFQDVYNPVKDLTLTAGLYYTQSKNGSGKPGYGEVTSKNGLYFYPYAQFADANGDPLPMVKDYAQSYIQTAGDGKLPDWNYYPLTDYLHTPATTTINDVTINAGANYKIIGGLAADFKYQYERQSTDGRNLYDNQSYFARNMVNRYTQIGPSGAVTNNIPPGGILDLSNAALAAQDMRGQLNFDHAWGKSSLAAIGGGELRQAHTTGNTGRLYGYNDDLLNSGNVDYTRQYPDFVTGSGEYIPGRPDVSDMMTRYVSVFANAAYTYDGKYTVSLSGRRDASNLFGLNTNNEWNPFWSAGAAWNISDEPFYHSKLLPYLKLRATYGSSGNINPAMVAATTIAYEGSNPFTNTPLAQFRNYYNPDLKWETSHMLNLGLDFKLINDRVTGSLEYYHKKGTDLFGTAVIDYTGGIGSQVIKNVAGMKAHGIDAELHSLNLHGKFRWSTTLNFSFYHDEITDYYLNSLQGSNFITTNATVTYSGLAGKPVYSVFAYKWAGLDPATGAPRGYLNAQISENYNLITGSGTQVGQLKYFGSALPTKYGSFLNNFSYAAFTLTCSFVYKLGYYFRRNSINYTNLYNNWQGDPDYALRWQKPGDELKTTVPAMIYPANSASDKFYSGSEVLVDRADNIRLQFVNLAYDLSKSLPKTSPFKTLQVYVNASDLGIVWRANKHHIDPDYYNSPYALKPPATYAIGLRSGF